MQIPETDLIPLGEVAAPFPNSFVDGPFGSEMKSDEYTQTGVRLIQLQNIGDGKWLDDNKKFISREKFIMLKRHGAVPGDIVIAKMADPVARCCTLPPVNDQFIVVADCIKLTPDPARFNTDFISRAINSYGTRREAELKSSGTTRLRINLSVLKTVRIWVPSLPHQSRIAAVLDTVDEAIAKTEALIAKLEQVRVGLLHDLLTRGLDEHGQLRDAIAHPEQFKDSQLGRIPREWIVSSIDNTVSQPSDLTIGPFGSNLLASDYRSKGTPVVFVRDVREDGFVWTSNIYVDQDKANEIRAHSVFANDVLITKMGLPPCIASVYPDTMPSGVITADVIRLRPRVDIATSFWLTSYINSPRFAACIRKITGGVTRPKVTLTDFRKQPVLLPSVEEQRHLEKMAMSMTGAIEELEAELQKLLMLKSGLSADLLTGRVQVPENLDLAEVRR